MKRYSNRNSRISIQAAQSPGTTFYKITLDDALEALKSSNLILQHLLSTKGWDALDFETYYYGSTVSGDTLYLCDTDGIEIDIRGQIIEPEYAIEELGIDGIEPYVQEATPEVIKRNISTYELKPFNMDDVAYELLGEDYSFIEIYKAADDAHVLDL